MCFKWFKKLFSNWGGFRGWAGVGGGRSFSGIRPLTDPKGPSFEIFSDIQFWLTDPKVFLKTALASIYTYFKGGALAKKTRFSKKCLKTLFWPVFVQSFACSVQILTKTGTF